MLEDQYKTILTDAYLKTIEVGNIRQLKINSREECSLLSAHLKVRHLKPNDSNRLKFID
jgi:hypothetical protein